MNKLWRNKIFQWAIRILIIVSMVMVADRLHTLKFIIESGHITMEGISAESLVKDIKVIQIIGAIIWTVAIGSYNYFIDSINKENTKIDNKE